MDNELKKNCEKKIVCGTGLLALDVIINGDPERYPQLRAGGSCGNILIILSYLGWKSIPISRLKQNESSDELLKDMEKWNVNTDFINFDEKGSTPIIVERIKKDKYGKPFHRFEWRCPCCGSFLPTFRPILEKNVDTIIENLPKPNVFYFDRVSSGILKLVKQLRDEDVLIFFEPSKIKNEKKYFECIKLADIVKYSTEEIKPNNKNMEDINIPLEIETLGNRGLRYRFGKKSKKWNLLDSYINDKFIDAAGAGDWCSAAIIHLLCKNGKEIIYNFDDNKIRDILNLSQIIASLSCNYEGARGLMYNLSRDKLIEKILQIWEHGDDLILERQNENTTLNDKVHHICPKCPEQNENIKTEKKGLLIIH